MSRLRKSRTIKRDLAKLTKEMYDNKEFKEFNTALKLRQQSGDLVSRRVAEAVIKTGVDSLVRELNECTRQLVNIAGEGKTKAEKVELGDKFKAQVDTVLSTFRETTVLPSDFETMAGRETVDGDVEAGVERQLAGISNE